MGFPTTNLHIGDRWSEGYKNYEWNGSDWEENEICIPDHHWKFNEDSNATTYASDSGIFPKQLTKIGTSSTLGNIGKINNSALIGYDEDDGFRSSSTESITVYGATISCWVKTRTTTKKKRMTYSRYNGTTYLFLYIYDDSGTETVKGNFMGQYVNVPYNISTLAWHFICVRYRSDGSDAVLDTYIDGLLIDSSSVSHTSQTFSSSTTSEYQHQVGNYRPTLSDYDFDGYLEDVRVYHRPISDLDILNIYNNSLGTHSQFNTSGYPTIKYPIHHWKLDEDSSESSLKVSDSGSKPLLLSEYGTVTQQTGMIGNSSYFETTSDYLSAKGLNETYSEFTCSFFIKTNFTDGNYAYSLYYYKDTSNRIEIGSWYDTRGSQLYLRFRIHTSSILYYAISPDIDYYFTITYNSSDIILYKNLTSVYTSALSNNSSTFDTSSTLKIGMGTCSNTGEYIVVDDVKLYNYCLSKEERENNYYLYLEQKESL